MPELAAANDTGPTIDDGAPLASVSVDTGEAQAATDGPSGHSAPAKLAELLDDAPAHEHGTASSHHADDAAPADSGWEADDSGSHAAAPGAGSEAVADFGDASGALFDFGGGEALMDALLVTAPGDAAGLAAQALAPVREAVAEAAAEAAVDAVVGHFADAGTAVPLGAEPASHVLLEALDAQLVFAGNGGLAPDAIDDAADLAAAAQA